MRAVRLGLEHVLNRQCAVQASAFGAWGSSCSCLSAAAAAAGYGAGASAQRGLSTTQRDLSSPFSATPSAAAPASQQGGGEDQEQPYFKPALGREKQKRERPDRRNPHQNKFKKKRPGEIAVTRLSLSELEYVATRSLPEDEAQWPKRLRDHMLTSAEREEMLQDRQREAAVQRAQYLEAKRQEREAQGLPPLGERKLSEWAELNALTKKRAQEAKLLQQQGQQGHGHGQHGGQYAGQGREVADGSPGGLAQYPDDVLRAVGDIQDAGDVDVAVGADGRGEATVTGAGVGGEGAGGGGARAPVSELALGLQSMVRRERSEQYARRVARRSALAAASASASTSAAAAEVDAADPSAVGAAALAEAVRRREDEGDVDVDADVDGEDAHGHGHSGGDVTSAGTAASPARSVKDRGMKGAAAVTPVAPPLTEREAAAERKLSELISLVNRREGEAAAAGGDDDVAGDDVDGDDVAAAAVEGEGEERDSEGAEGAHQATADDVAADGGALDHTTHPESVGVRVTPRLSQYLEALESATAGAEPSHNESRAIPSPGARDGGAALRAKFLTSLVTTLTPTMYAKFVQSFVRFRVRAKRVLDDYEQGVTDVVHSFSVAQHQQQQALAQRQQLQGQQGQQHHPQHQHAHHRQGRGRGDGPAEDEMGGEHDREGGEEGASGDAFPEIRARHVVDVVKAQLAADAATSTATSPADAASRSLADDAFKAEIGEGAADIAEEAGAAASAPSSSSSQHDVADVDVDVGVDVDGFDALPSSPAQLSIAAATALDLAQALRERSRKRRADMEQAALSFYRAVSKNLGPLADQFTPMLARHLRQLTVAELERARERGPEATMVPYSAGFLRSPPPAPAPSPVSPFAHLSSSAAAAATGEGAATSPSPTQAGIAPVPGTIPAAGNVTSGVLVGRAVVRPLAVPRHELIATYADLDIETNEASPYLWGRMDALERTAFPVYVDGIPPTATTREVMQAFGRCGTVLAVEIFRGARLTADALAASSSSSSYSSSSSSEPGGGLPRKGRKDVVKELERFNRAAESSGVYGFVYFQTQEAAARALHKSVQIFGMCLHDVAMRTRPVDARKTLHVRGLRHRMSHADVTLTLRRRLESEGLFSAITNIQVPHAGPKNRGYALVTFNSHWNARRAGRLLNHWVYATLPSLGAPSSQLASYQSVLSPAAAAAAATAGGAASNAGGEVEGVGAAGRSLTVFWDTRDKRSGPLPPSYPLLPFFPIASSTSASTSASTSSVVASAAQTRQGALLSPAGTTSILADVLGTSRVQSAL